ncbi:MAG: hypothetical protein F8N37_01405 [Telmatospirillum sp.]|nr:hypothetical protein [Telmatospirillum sp.]
MLKTRLLHPDLLWALARSGHGSRILIADGNYPVASRSAASAARVHLNLAPGLIGAAEVLSVLLDSIPVEGAAVMRVPNGARAEIQDDYRRMIPAGIAIDTLDRQPFYDAVCDPLTSLVIATGETRRFANLLLTVGVVKLERDEPY